METFEAQKCSCGAITIFQGSESWSMRPSAFKQELAGEYKFKWLPVSCCCNHCVNNWGIDLCGCGSGEKVGKCSGNFEECKNSTPAQTLFEEKELVLWRF